MRGLCRVKSCGRKAVAHGICSGHYRRKIVHGNVLANKPLRAFGKGSLHTKTPEYRAWQALRNRCNNPRNDSYRNYGARGIKVCARWDTFDRFLKDVGKRPSNRHSLDRINNNGNYTPANCRWATREMQVRNRRPWWEWTRK